MRGWGGARVRATLALGLGLYAVRAAADSDDGPELGWADGGDGAFADGGIPDKIGVEVRLSKAERKALKRLECSMCRSIVHEMHAEVSKHSMTAKGWGSEEQVWETSNAICLALLQKYKLDLSTPSLVRKPEDEDEESMLAAGADSSQVMRAMLVLKMGCQRWVEDYGGDLSGYIFKAVRSADSSADASAEQYCSGVVALCGKGSKERRKKSEEAERKRRESRGAMVREQEKEEAKQAKDDPFSSLPGDSKLGLQRMLEMARDDPLHYMDEDAKARVQKARRELRCDVCRVLLQEVHDIASKRPRGLRREHDLLKLFEAGCDGGRDLSVPTYFGVEPPPLPPAWTDRYRPRLREKRYALKPAAKKAARARAQWRALAAEGKQKPPPQEESEGDMMMTFACKDALEPARMAEALFKRMEACAVPGCREALPAAVGDVCRAADGARCEGPEAAEEL